MDLRTRHRRARAPSPTGTVEDDGFSSYWPGIADDPANRALSEDHRELSRIYNQLPKVVVSDSRTPPPENPWYDITTVLRRGEQGAAGR